MEVILAESAGFCFGVKRAVDTVYEQVEKQMGKQIYYFLNYSGEEQKAVCPEGTWTELFSGETKKAGDQLMLQKWNLLILEEQ